MDALYTDVIMATPDQTSNIDIFSAIGGFFNSIWGWLIPMVGGIFHLGKVQQRITEMSYEVDSLKKLHTEVAHIKAGVDILLEDRRRG